MARPTEPKNGQKMAKKFRDLVAQLPEERQQKIREGTQALLAEMDLEIIAQWLFRRYAITADREVTWERQGGKVKGPWYGDAQGILDALEKKRPGT